MQFNDEEGDDTSYLQRTGNGRGRQQHLKSTTATPPPAKPRVGGAVAAGQASSTAAPKQPQAQRNDTRVEPDSVWSEINSIED